MKSGKLLEENTSSPITPNVTLPKEKLLKNPNENISWTPYLNSLPLTTENGVNLVDALIEQPQTARERSKEIDKALKNEKEELETLGRKILLLGPASSGKSTLLRQMRLLHSGGFSEMERNIFKSLIYTNVIQNMTELVKGIEQLELVSPPDKATFNENSKLLTNYVCENHGSPPPDQIKQTILYLWGHNLIKDAYNKHGNELNIQETAGYFFNDLPRIWGPGYSPSDQDIIYTRNATETISETRIMVKNERLRIIDVGGHRHLRIHWKSHFDDVKAILFVVAISSYNQVMEEDGETNRMVDAIALFDQIINDPAFKQTSIILLLNKMDLFEEKIKTVHVKDYFDDFDGASCDPKAAKLFFRERFERCALPKKILPNASGRRHSEEPSKKREIYTHFTTNTDTKLTGVIIITVADIIMKQA